MSNQYLNGKGKYRDEHDKTGDTLTAPLVANSLETTTQIPKYHGKGGHGFAAEDANNISDRLRGRNATVVGKSNELNGPDRIVDGVKVQSNTIRPHPKLSHLRLIQLPASIVIRDRFLKSRKNSTRPA